MLVSVVIEQNHLERKGYNTCSCPASKAIAELCKPGVVVQVRMVNLTLDMGTSWVTMPMPIEISLLVRQIDVAMEKKDEKMLDLLLPSPKFQLDIPEEYLKEASCE